jgi:SET and MYND domain-containing protein
LLSNREKLLSSVANDEDAVSKIRDGAKAIAVARRMGKDSDSDSDSGGDCVVEEAVLCVVLTNAVEVQVKGEGNIGIALYGTDFSWINHSCSPNACYRFLLQPEFAGCESRLRIAPASSNSNGGIDGECYRLESTNGDHSFLFSV